MKNILLLEDHPIFRFGVRQLVAQRWPEATISEAGTLAEALATSQQIPFQIAVADLNLPDADGLEVISQLIRALPQLRLLVLSLNSETAYAQRALKLGAMGYLAKDRAAQELISAMERIAASGRYISASLAEQLADSMTGEHKTEPHEELSDQEYRVLLQLANGRRVSDIADALHLSTSTISTYRSRILKKLQLVSNADLVRYCISHGLLDQEGPCV
ncbi:MAG: response regulator transcription factor [Nitrospirae bacterium]|nr:response regulator transcription factor [Nitrospirota bacterium]